MATRPPEGDPYLRRPLYVFDLPPELLESLTLRTSGNAQPVLPEPTEVTTETVSSAASEDGVSPSTSCTLCKASYTSVSEQRQHVRSDLHRYNLKLHIKGLPPIDDQTFIKQIGELDESISGSDTSESEEDDGAHVGDSTLSALLRRQAKLSVPDEADYEHAGATSKKAFGGGPIIWLSSPKTANDVGLGVYKSILSDAEQEEAQLHMIEVLRRKQVNPMTGKNSGQAHPTNGAIPAMASSDPHFFLCMIGGGHFAAAIISLVPEVRKGVGGIEERHAIVKAHKTFHRYTTRRKQGGAQSANDNAKGNAHSAGSSIRRYNEAALEADVRNILTQWKGMIDSANLLFIRATGSTSRRTLFGPYDGQVLSSRDTRLRGFPFSTRRPTQNELVRSFQELTRVKVSTFTEREEVKPKPDATPKAVQPKPQQPKRSKEEETALLHTSQLQNLIRRTKAPGTLLYIAKNELSPNFEFYPASEYHHAPTPLHLSASINSPAMVTALLVKCGADPTVCNADGKTAYDVAGDHKTRDAFRIARHQLGNTSIDWAAAHVPSALSPEQAEAKIKQEQQASDAAEAERRKADLDRIQQEEESRKVTRMAAKAGTGKTLGAMVEKTGSEKREEEMRGLTPDMRQRLERERRARAVDARLNAMNGQK